jgi:hypothetical protein
MFNRIALALAIALPLIFAKSVFAEPNMQEGLWEITMKMEMQGMPFEMPPMKSTQCLTKKDMVPQKQEKDQECKIVEQKIVGDTVSWSAKCTHKDAVSESKGKITYKGSIFDGFINTTTVPKGELVQTTKMSGKRIGDCR